MNIPTKFDVLKNHMFYKKWMFNYDKVYLYFPFFFKKKIIKFLFTYYLQILINQLYIYIILVIKDS